MNAQSKEHAQISELAKSAIVTGLYVTLTLCLAPISYGMIQLRLSEMFNQLIHYNKRYLWAITLGVFIANAYSFGPIDMVVGSLATFIFLSFSLLITKHIQDMRKKQLITSLLMAASMLAIAFELKILELDDHSFWLIFITMAIGEFLSTFLGGFIIRFIANQVDLTK